MENGEKTKGGRKLSPRILPLIIKVKMELERQEDEEDSLHCSSTCITKQFSDDLETEALLNFQTFFSLSVKNDPNTSNLR